MAQDWIKMRKDLLTHPKVVRIMSATKADKFRTIGGLLSAWSLFDDHSEDGQLVGYTPELLDAMIGWDGFASALMSVNWLDYQETEDGSILVMTGFENHNGKSAKRRANDSLRKKSVRKMSANEADKKRTREEKRREDIYTHDDAPTTSSKVDPNNLTKPQFLDALIERGVDPDIASEWHSIRKLKRAVFSLGAIERTEREAQKAKISFVKAIEICVAKGWRGFEAQYLDGDFSTTKKEPTPPSRKILNKDLPPELLQRLQA